MSNQLAGLNYTLLNIGVDEATTTDICRKVFYGDFYFQLEMYAAAGTVVKATKKGDKNCDFEIAFLTDLILRKIPLNYYSAELLRMIGQLALFNNYGKYSNLRIAIGEFFFNKDKTLLACLNCLSNNRASTSWDITSKGQLACTTCRSIDSFLSCLNCNYFVFKVDKKDNIKCSKCGETLSFSENSKTNSGQNLIEYGLILMSIIYKSDGQVSQEEVNKVVEVLKIMGYNEKERKNLLKFMKESKGKYQFETVIDDVKRTFSNDIQSKLSLLRLVLHAASADKIYHPNEEKLILYIVRNLDIDTSVYEQLKKEIFAGNVIDVRWCYEKLECEFNDSDQKIKEKYRELQKKYHPDKFDSLGLPEDVKSILEERTKELNIAIEGLKFIRKTLRF